VVADDQTFSYTASQALSINQTGRPGSPLVIKRSGTGTNAPVIQKQRGGGYYNHFMIIGGARYFTIDGISFIGTGGGTAESKYFTGLTFTSADNQTVENVEIKNCKVDLDVLTEIGSANDARFGGVGVRIGYSYDNISSGGMNNIKIHHNQFLNLRVGIYLGRVNGTMGNIEINNNTVTSFVNTGIDVNSSNNTGFEGPVSIHDNNLTGTSINVAGDYSSVPRDYRGINVYKSAGSSSIYNNKVSTITNTNANSRVFGISAQGVNANAVANIYNNMIWGLSAPNSTNAEACSAFQFVNTGSFNVYHNTAVLNYATATANTSRIVLTYSNESPKIEMINNIFVNNIQVSGTAKAAVLDVNPAFVLATTDNNLYFAGVPGVSNLINLNGSKQSLATYQPQVTGKDVNSVSENPPFVSASDIHISTNSTLASNGGKPVALVTTDIDGNARSATNPDMGAGEFNFKVTSISSVTSETGALVYTLNRQIVADMSKVNGNAVVSVIDVKGSVLKTMNNNASSILTFHVANSGIYLVRIQNGDKLSIHKVVLF